MAAKLLIVWHSATGGAERLARAVVDAAALPEVGDVEIRERRALESTVDETVGDVLWADGVVLVTPENFGYMSGAMKHFFDTIYNPCLDRTRGLPYALVVRGGNDGTGTVTAIERITTGLGWRRVLPPVLVIGPAVDGEHVEAAFELGGSMAAGLAEGIF